MNHLSVAYPSVGRAWYIVALLTLAYIISFLDRQIMALLIEPIKMSLDLSDTQVGLLLGPAFAVFYVTLGYPAGMLADRKSRKAIVAAGISVWCIMTALCGLARDFKQLFAARVGVGVGEATLTPAALSMICDCFPPDRRARPISVYMTGISLGSALAYLIGGQLLEPLLAMPPLNIPVLGVVHPWQAAFLIVGLPGLVLAILIAAIREPARQELNRALEASTARQARMTALSYMGERWQAYSSLTIGMCANTIIGYVASWNVVLFQRRWDWGIAEIGVALGSILIVFGPLGTLCGGALADRMARAGLKDAAMRVTIAAIVVMVVFTVAYPVTDSPLVVLGLYAVAVAAAAAASATGAVALLALSPNQIRAQATALYWIVKNLAGLMLGPLSVGLLTDRVFDDPARVGSSMALASAIFGILGIAALVMGFRHYRACAEGTVLGKTSTANA
ncbi:MAG: MFS transporter [Steroidobacteraceae bacterium]